MRGLVIGGRNLDKTDTEDDTGRKSLQERHKGAIFQDTGLRDETAIDLSQIRFVLFLF